MKLVEQLLACVGTNFTEKCHLKLVEQLLACIGKKYLKLTDYAGWATLSSSAEPQLDWLKRDCLQSKLDILLRNAIWSWSNCIAGVWFWYVFVQKHPRPTAMQVNPLSPIGDQHQFSTNEIHTSLRDKVMRMNDMITKEKMLWSFVNSLNLFFYDQFGAGLSLRFQVAG